MTQSDSASVTVPNQRSDGESITIADASTPVEATLSIVSLDRETPLAGIRLEEGASLTERTVELSTTIQESQQIQATIVTPDGKLASDRALVAVGESLSSAREQRQDSPSARPDLPGETELVEPDPDAGFRLPYALYKPDTSYESPRPLFVEPLNGPETPTETALREQLRDAVASGTFSQAHELGLPGLVPGLPHLPRPGNDEVQSLELPSLNFPGRLAEVATDAFPAESLRRVDRQVVRMIQDAKRRLSAEGYPVASTIHMDGFSSSAQFASRFALLYPSLVNTITIGGNGAYPLPKASHGGRALPYPLGTANYESVTGRTFNRDRWTQITQYIYVGREDQPLPGNESDYYSISHAHEQNAVAVFGENRVTERFPTTKSVYTEADANATFRIYDGLGHELTGETVGDTQARHRETMNTADDWPVPADLLLAVPDPTPTQTATATSTSTTTPTMTTRQTGADDGTTTTTDRDTADGSGPGLGVWPAVTGFGVVAYLVSRRRGADGDE